MNQQTPPFDNNSNLFNTRVHILTAGRELLLAAKGALQFCSKYVEANSNSTPNLKAFFKKAITVADDLSSGLKDMDAIKKAASSAIKPIFTVMEEEMAQERKATPSRSTTSREMRTKKTRTKKNTRSKMQDTGCK